MARIDDILAGIMKGAQDAGASVEQQTIGREEKLAVIGPGLGALMGSSLTGLVADAGQVPNWIAGIPMAGVAGGGLGAVLGADEGRKLHAAGGALLGGVAGGALGGMIPGLRGAGAALGTMGGSALGGHLLGHKDEGLIERVRDKFSSAEDAYLAGSKEAADNFKIAFLPLLGMAASALAPMAARAGLSRIAGGALGKVGGGMLGRAAGGLASAAAKPVGGALFDMGVGSAASKMVQPQQPQ